MGALTKQLEFFLGSASEVLEGTHGFIDTIELEQSHEH
tara:strand:- start:284 stop:397 length:114 start_codon:yes stop_codon:yes gene_type:complete